MDDLGFDTVWHQIDAVKESLVGLSEEQIKLVLQNSKLDDSVKKVILSETSQKIATDAASTSQAAQVKIVDVLKMRYKELATSLGISTTALGVFAATLLVAGGVIFAISKCSNAIDDLRDNAENLGKEFNSNKSSIENYKKQIIDLYNTIDNSESSVEQVADARKELLVIQDELIEKFGDEKESIDLVTQAIYNQTDALDLLSKKQWQSTLNEFNQSSFWQMLGNAFQGYDDNIERMLDEYENYELNVALDGIIKTGIKNVEASDAFRAYLSEQLGLDVSSDGWSVKISGNADEVLDTILQIQSELENFEVADSANQTLANLANSIEDVADKYRDIYKQYTLYEEIFPDEALSNSFFAINDAYAAYKEAFASGEGVDEAIANFSHILSTAVSQTDDKSVIDYFNSMYPTLQAEIDKWEFKTKITAQWGDTTLQDMTQDDIWSMLGTEGNQRGELMVRAVIDSAKTYGIIDDESVQSIQTLLDLLSQWGIIKQTIANNQETSSSLTIEDIENQISLLESRKKELDNFIKMTETAGYTVSKDMYDQLIAEEEKVQDNLIQERDILIKSLEDGLDKGTITEYDDSWYELMGQINEVTLSIQESGISIYEYQNKINELDWSNFDKLREIMSDLVEESNFLIELLSNEKLINDVGDYTDAGLATLGQHSANREIYLNEVEEYRKKIAELDKQYEGKEDNEYYIKQRRAWVDAMRDNISAAEDEKQAMVDLARDGIQAQIDYTQELIDKKKELLSQEQELYEYQKSINEKTDNIANIRKQLSVYENDTSEEGRQKVQQLRNQLKEAEEDLEDTQYNKWVQDQTDMLDDLMTEYEELQNKLSEDTERLFTEVKDVIATNGETINNTLTTTASNYNYNMSEEMSSIRDAFVGDNDSIKSVFEKIESDFKQAVLDMQEMAKKIGEIIDGGTDTESEYHTQLPYLVKIDSETITDNVTKSILEKLDLSNAASNAVFQSTIGALLDKTVTPAVTNAMNQFTQKLGDTTIEIGDIVLPNVSDAKQFVDQLTTVLQNSSKVQKLIQGMTTDLIGGKSFMALYKH